MKTTSIDIQQLKATLDAHVPDPERPLFEAFQLTHLLTPMLFEQEHEKFKRFTKDPRKYRMRALDFLLLMKKNTYLIDKERFYDIIKDDHFLFQCLDLNRNASVDMMDAMTTEMALIGKKRSASPTTDPKKSVSLKQLPWLAPPKKYSIVSNVVYINMKMQGSTTKQFNHYVSVIGFNPYVLTCADEGILIDTMLKPLDDESKNDLFPKANDPMDIHYARILRERELYDPSLPIVDMTLHQALMHYHMYASTMGVDYDIPGSMFATCNRYPILLPVVYQHCKDFGLPMPCEHMEFLIDIFKQRIYKPRQFQPPICKKCCHALLGAKVVKCHACNLHGHFACQLNGPAYCGVKVNLAYEDRVIGPERQCVCGEKHPNMTLEEFKNLGSDFIEGGVYLIEYMEKWIDSFDNERIWEDLCQGKDTYYIRNFIEMCQLFPEVLLMYPKLRKVPLVFMGILHLAPYRKVKEMAYELFPDLTVPSDDALVLQALSRKADEDFGYDPMIDILRHFVCLPPEKREAIKTRLPNAFLPRSYENEDLYKFDLVKFYEIIDGKFEGIPMDDNGFFFPNGLFESYSFIFDTPSVRFFIEHFESYFQEDIYRALNLRYISYLPNTFDRFLKTCPEKLMHFPVEYLKHHPDKVTEIAVTYHPEPIIKAQGLIVLLSHTYDLHPMKVFVRLLFELTPKMVFPLNVCEALITYNTIQGCLDSDISKTLFNFFNMGMMGAIYSTCSEHFKLYPFVPIAYCMAKYPEKVEYVIHTLVCIGAFYFHTFNDDEKIFRHIKIHSRTFAEDGTMLLYGIPLSHVVNTTRAFINKPKYHIYTLTFIDAQIHEKLMICKDQRSPGERAFTVSQIKPYLADDLQLITPISEEESKGVENIFRNNDRREFMSSHSYSYFIRGTGKKERSVRKTREIILSAIMAMTATPKSLRLWRHIELFKNDQKISIRLQQKGHFIEQLGPNGLKVLKAVIENNDIPFNENK